MKINNKTNIEPTGTSDSQKRKEETNNEEKSFEEVGGHRYEVGGHRL